MAKPCDTDLPISDAEFAGPAAVECEPDQPTMLVVDDDFHVRACLRACLEHGGIQVWTAASGEEAVDLYRRHQHRIRLVLLDVNMPGLDGPETLKRLRALNPKVCSCFMAGGLCGYQAEDLVRLGATLVLAKPFDAMERAAIFRQIARGQK